MPLIVFILGGVPPCSITAGVVIVFFTRFSLDVTYVTVFLASIGEFPFYPVSGPLRVFAFGQSLPEVLYFLIEQFRLIQTVLALWVRVLITPYLAAWVSCKL